ncbi:L-lactate dehydrogenase [Saitoella complicata NRRL Y-17804]|uniref:Oxidase FUB9 n=1 Tax=Saitoella complicata (strain BCRC 22490 / CBS 7301 / JCM 7358 / NBRC 10748 / NRRL Y-17804) TaxID=698492 RepID=A0A0E9NQ75_SAICN|nr:L-lactate dehydrogenase [Saitoella complicata NRRL Y-17804]ODQ55010.1 L-lactate dehydrogenase [Saitoella complicata NRRL Y-17804]GAO51575.1 hypothetical protein G7K_5674-t1 [Saitoella complicata NRRL Y-17804]
MVAAKLKTEKSPVKRRDPLPHDTKCLTIDELQKLAAENMDKQTRDYYNEGADKGTTLRENLDAFQKYRIRPRVLRDVSQCDPSIELFGKSIPFPCAIAPTAMQKLAHPEGEVATSKAAAKFGTVMGLSSFSTTTLEEVAEHRGENDNVLQLYVFEERHHTEKLLKRAKKAGYKAVFLTVDTPVLGRRNCDIRNQFTLPPHLQIANFPDENGNSSSADPPTSKKASVRFHTHAANPTLSWEKDIEWLKEQCHPEMEVWIKGVATAEDTELAIKHGVDGVVVSNHGGRQLDGAMATLDALPDVARAARGRIPVHVDGGIRHGTDIFKAIALGADCVWIGRPVLWGLSYKGQEGVERCLSLLYDEFLLCMGLAGVKSVKEITKEYLVRIDGLNLSRL